MTRMSLRNSCDQCRQSKVRCAFEPPTSSSCLRCIRRGDDCTRNPPLPLGRRPSASSCGTRRRKNFTLARGAPPSSKHEPITPEASGTSSPTSPHVGLAFEIGTPPNTNNTSGLSLATAPTTDASAASTHEYATLPLEWFNIDFETPICVSSPGERSGRNPMATGAEEALLPPPPPPPPGSPAGSELFVGSNFAVCRCGEDAADAITALQGSRAAFDHVLHHAKNAMAVLERFCTCDGYHESSGLVLICFLAQKVATAYRQTLCTCGASARNGGVLIPEVRFGSYRIVGEEGLLLMRQVVVAELRKLRRTVDRLREKLRGGGCDNAHSSLLQGFLQAELKSVLA